MKPVKTLISKKQMGFSLIELMVVVAIIGMLAAVAVPQFGKFQARAKQTEAQTALSGIYTSEASFFAQYNIYADGLLLVGYSPNGKLSYDAGFSGGTALAASSNGWLSSAGVTALTTDATDTMSVCNSPCGSAATGAVMGANGCCSLGSADSTGLVAISSSSAYTAKAVGKIYNGNPDTWQIDQNKNLFNSVPGIK